MSSIHPGYVGDWMDGSFQISPPALLMIMKSGNNWREGAQQQCCCASPFTTMFFTCFVLLYKTAGVFLCFTRKQQGEMGSAVSIVVWC